MGTSPGASEIVEAVEEPGHHMVKPGQKFSIEDDINRLFDAIDVRNSGRVVRQNLQKKSMKRPIIVSSSQASGIGISESVSLKQALRGLSISQASEMAAMKRSKPPAESRVSEAGTIKRLYRAVVVEASESGHPINKGKGNLVEISFVSERSTSDISGKMPESQHVAKVELSTQSADSSNLSVDASTQKAKPVRTLLQTEISSFPADVGSEMSNVDSEQSAKLKPSDSLFPTHSRKKLQMADEIVPGSFEVLVKSLGQEKEQKVKLHAGSPVSGSPAGSRINKSASSSARLMKPLFRNKNFVKKKIKHDPSSVISSSNQCIRGVDSNMGPSTSETIRHTPGCAPRNANKEKDRASPASSNTNFSIGVSLSSVGSSASTSCVTSKCCNKSKTVVTKAERSRSREKGEFSQSSSSIGEYSSSTAFSEESNLSGSSRIGSRPHMSKDSRWEAIRCIQKQHGSLGLRHFKLLRKLGGGDIGTVYLADLTGRNCLFALKVMDNEFLAVRKKMPRAQTEKEILQMLDHPFLPTLYAHFMTDKFSCLVMEYCPGGDLHVLRQKQSNKSFSEQAVRFYVAEVLLALEYLHMLGVVYRDLKPENILVREDGHIMLSDFDLSLRCAAHPTLLKSSSPVIERQKRESSPCAESSCIDPFCLQPSWQVSCFTPKVLSAAAKTRKLKADLAAQVNPLPQLVVEPTNARSNSFVGTHEYLAPEIIKGEGHGSPVDWWTFGIFTYELLYGKTPFKGTGNDDTLQNVVSKCLKFPESPIVSSHARDLIRRLLKKEPENRLGFAKGAAEIKQHPFFEGMNWALVRCAIPPELPKVFDFGSVVSDMPLQNNGSTNKECKSIVENTVFEMF